MATRLIVVALCFLGGHAADDTSALVQGALRVGQESEWQAGSMLQGGDMGVAMRTLDVDDLKHSSPPVPLTAAASDFMIPALGGSKSLTKDVLGFRLWRVDDGQMRTFRSVDPDGFFLYGTKSVQDTKRGRTVLYDSSNKKKLAVMWMDTKDAAVRQVKLPSAAADLRDRMLGLSYTINAYNPLCAGQGSIGEEHDTGAPLYAFAKVSKATGKDSWTVKRIACGDEDGKSGVKWNLAYNLDHHGLKTAMEATSPTAGVIGSIDTLLSQDMHKEEETMAHSRYEAWLAPGEDPALFAAALMVTQMPGNPNGPKAKAEAAGALPAKASLLQTSSCDAIENMPDCEEAGCTWNTDNEDPGNEHCA